MDPTGTLKAALQQWGAVFMRGSMRRLLAYSKDSGLSMAQLVALLHIQRKGVTAVSEIGDDLGVTPAAASQMLERLVVQGLVARSEDPRDRRAKQIVLTPEGQRRFQESLRVRQGWLDNLADRLSPMERGQVTAALQILIERANQLEAGPFPGRDG